MSTPEPSARQILKVAAPYLAGMALIGAVIMGFEIAERSTFDLRGTLTVTDGRCGSAGFNDISAGSQVRVVNGANELLAAGQLDAGAAACQWRFTVKDVPSGERMYGVTAGNSSRGVLWGSEDEARAGVALTLG